AEPGVEQLVHHPDLGVEHEQEDRAGHGGRQGERPDEQQAVHPRALHALVGQDGQRHADRQPAHHHHGAERQRLQEHLAEAGRQHAGEDVAEVLQSDEALRPEEQVAPVHAQHERLDDGEVEEHEEDQQRRHEQQPGQRAALEDGRGTHGHLPYAPVAPNGWGRCNSRCNGPGPTYRRPNLAAQKLELYSASWASARRLASSSAASTSAPPRTFWIASSTMVRVAWKVPIMAPAVAELVRVLSSCSKAVLAFGNSSNQPSASSMSTLELRTG